MPAFPMPVTRRFLIFHQQLIHLLDDGREFAGILGLLCSFL
jgi:hypothetical protein